VTGYDADEVREELLLRGATYLGKSYGRSNIRDALTQLTAMSRAA
jgi:hypothetical protein